MQYKLIKNSKNDTNNIIQTVLLNRGIKNPKEYLHLTEENECDWNDLENINDAVECFASHFDKNDPIAILVDSDPDGYSSAAMMYNYIKLMDKNYPVHYILHEKNKAHGLVDMDFTIPANTKLLILPDSSTNDYKECNQLIDGGMSIIILDHHVLECENSSNKAIIVNNQTSTNYSNKDFCGAGITYEFLRALDEYYWQFYADTFLDLAAFGNISDIMNLATFATRYIVDKGLMHISNPELKAMIKAQDYSMHGEINIHNITWYVTPIFNAMIRIGSMEERDLLFNAFICNYKEFDYKKRGGEIVKENIYDRAVRLCKNAKSRQDKLRDKLFDELINKVNYEDKVIIIETDNGDAGIIGLSCMKLADKMQRPSVILKKTYKDGKEILAGSCRNFNNSPLVSLKDTLNNTNLCIYAQGHDNAAGVAILPENINTIKTKLNATLKDIVYDPSYRCDFILNVYDIDVRFITEIYYARDIWCQGISEPLIAVENVNIVRKDITIQGSNHDSVAFTINDVKFVQFKLNDGDPLYEFINSWEQHDDDKLKLNIVGTCSINTYQGVSTPQFIINGVETIQD